MSSKTKAELLDVIIDNVQEWEAMQSAINVLDEWHGNDEIIATLEKRQKELDEECKKLREKLKEE